MFVAVKRMKNIIIILLVIGMGILGREYMRVTEERDMVMHKYYEIVVLYNQQVPPSRNQLRELEQEWGHIR